MARPLSGGTDLLVQMRSGRIEPEIVVDLKRIPEMRNIMHESGGYRIGAAVSGSELAEHAELAAEWPGLVEAAMLVGSTQVCGRATLAGNLCNASPAADTVPAMVAANAIARIAGPDGIRTLRVQEVPIAPGKTSLERGEIVESIVLPRRKPRSADAYLRFTPRTEMDIAVVSAAVNIVLNEDGTVESARVALGAVAPTVRLVEEAGAALVGTKLDDAAMKAMGKACQAACSPIADKRGTVAFRTDVAGVLAKRAAQIAYNRAKESS